MLDEIFEIECPECNHEFTIRANTTPETSSKVTPIGKILVYRITSEEISQFLIQKARLYNPEIRTVAHVKYCERKKAKNEEKRAYASMMIAFTEQALDKAGNITWYERIGQSSMGLKFIDGIQAEFINRYSYDKDALNAIMDNYKSLEELENQRGINEVFLNDIRNYAKPQRVVAPTTKENWILFACRIDKIIEDMLSDPVTDKAPGRIRINHVNQINKDVVEFIVYVTPEEVKMEEDPYVRDLMIGKSKK